MAAEWNDPNTHALIFGGLNDKERTLDAPMPSGAHRRTCHRARRTATVPDERRRWRSHQEARTFVINGCEKPLSPGLKHTRTDNIPKITLIRSGN